MHFKRLLHSSPGLVVLCSLFLVILCGAGLLSLPAAQVQPIPFIDALFTATSATCVTGLFSVPLDQFTHFGHFVIMILVQIGGLGLITLTLMFLSLFVNFGLTTQLMAGHLLDLESWQNIKALLLFIACITLLSEFVGVLCITPFLMDHEPLTISIFYATFHAIASFCNAGIELPHTYYALLYKTNYFILGITMLLSLIGGLGFITWYEIASWVTSWWQGRRFRFSLHSKIIFYGTLVLITVSALTIWLLERHNAFASMKLIHSMVYALFQAITSKSTGFSIIPLSEFHLSTIFLIMIIAFIGSSPASTGSGIKITTFTILVATIKAALSGKTMVDIRGRRIAKDQIFKSIAICFLGLLFIGSLTFVLLVLENPPLFFPMFFEAWSALSNLGTSLNATQSLSMMGKIMVMIGMMIGRVGSFTLILGIKMIRWKDSQEFIYPEERVML